MLGHSGHNFFHQLTLPPAFRCRCSSASSRLVRGLCTALHSITSTGVDSLRAA